ncbi:MAG: phage transcriptional regulator, AlpA, partial [Cryobacterium sp.]|nr:phage transcriptional regulator, AlpA [Cryobacterium sp.]
MVGQTPHLSFICQKRLQRPCPIGRSGPGLEQFRALWGAAAHLRGMNDNSASTAARLEQLLTVQELSDYLGIPVATLYDWRVDHCGPKAVKLGHALRYPESA